MKQFVLIVVITLSCLVKGQTVCNPTFTPTDIFGASTTSTYATSGGILYLCGPNTVVYDTMANSSCHWAYLNSGSTLYLKGGSCGSSNKIWLRAGSLLYVLAGSSPVSVYSENSATVIVSGTVSVFSGTCSAISFPTVNCTSGINEIENEESSVAVWPNPFSQRIQIEFRNSDTRNSDLKIINALGQVILNRKNIAENTITLDAPELPNGIYFVEIIKNGRTYRSKIVKN